MNKNGDISPSGLAHPAWSGVTLTVLVAAATLLGTLGTGLLLLSLHASGVLAASLALPLLLGIAVFLLLSGFGVLHVCQQRWHIAAAMPGAIGPSIAERYAMFAEAEEVANFGSWVAQWDGDEVTLQWSPHCHRILGVPAEAFDGSSAMFDEIVHPDDQPAIAQASQHARASGEPYNIEHRIIRPDTGEVRWVREWARVEHHGTDHVRMVGVCQDITEQRRSVEAIRQVVEGISASVGQEFVQSLVRTLADAIGAHTVLVGRVQNGDHEHVHTLALWSGGRFHDNIVYNLAGTPCQGTLSRGYCMEARDVTDRYPDDAMLVDLRAQSYAGIALMNSAGKKVGLLIVIDDKPRNDLPMIESLLRLFGLRAASELEREDTYNALAQSEHRYRTFIQQSSEAVWRLEFEPPIPIALAPEKQAELMYKRAIIAECNDTYARIRDRQCAEELIGRRQRDIMPGRPDWLIRVFLAFVENDYRFENYESQRTDPAGNEFWYLNDVHGTIEHGRLVRAWGIQRDISERKRWELKQKLLMRELDHRVKNNLAAVLALAQQSKRESSTLEEFDVAFTGRITAMARTHEALASMRWEGVRLMAIVATSLPPFVPPDRIGELSSRDDVILPARAAIPVSLTLHELATNAAKHGAMTTPQGRINITWQVQGNAVDLMWREIDGPRIDHPPSPGLGLRLIRGLIEHEVAGEVDMAFEPQGLHCTVRIPLNAAPDSVPVPLMGLMPTSAAV